MFRRSSVIAMLIFSSLVQAMEASPLYQIDLIVFSHQLDSSLVPELSLHSTLSSASSQAIPLQTEANKNLTPYHLLPPSFSQLREEYWALHRKSQYRILMNYSWLQPLNNQSSIALPKINREGWQVEGNIRIKLANYYLFDTELLFSGPGDNHHPFVFAQKLRLKGGDIYYLDHPQVGMLIKIHKLA